MVTCRAPLPLVAHRSSLIIFSVTSFAWFSTIGTFSLMSSSPCMRAVGSDQCVQSVHTPVTASRGCAPRIQSESRILRVHAVYGKSRRPRVRVPREAACGTERGGMRYTRGSKRGCTIFKVDRWVACGVVGALSKNQETSRILSVRALKPLQTSLPPFGSFWVSFIEKGELATMYGGELQFHPCREKG